jgi:hypothetical protein
VFILPLKTKLLINTQFSHIEHEKDYKEWITISALQIDFAKII